MSGDLRSVVFLRDFFSSSSHWRVWPLRILLAVIGALTLLLAAGAILL